LVGHLRAHGHDELITLAGNVTNLAFDLLPALDSFGITPSLLILDDPPLPAAERARIFAGVQQRIRLLPASRGHAAGVALCAAARGRRAGRRPFALLPGGSHPAGILGNALGFLEMAAQLEARGQALPSAVLVTAATGTTLAGFVLAEYLLRNSGRAPVRVIGVAAYGGLTRLRTRALLAWSARALRVPLDMTRVRVEVDASALCGGFGHFDHRLIALCGTVGDAIGLAIDPIFGGKTWSVLQARAAELHASGRYPLYWHCGYTPEWALLGAAINRSTT
jgi:D-cysteine desulfhydrase